MLNLKNRNYRSFSLLLLIVLLLVVPVAVAAEESGNFIYDESKVDLFGINMGSSGGGSDERDLCLTFKNMEYYDDIDILKAKFPREYVPGPSEFSTISSDTVEFTANCGDEAVGGGDINIQKTDDGYWIMTLIFDWWDRGTNTGKKTITLDYCMGDGARTKLMVVYTAVWYGEEVTPYGPWIVLPTNDGSGTVIGGAINMEIHSIAHWENVWSATEITDVSDTIEIQKIISGTSYTSDLTILTPLNTYDVGSGSADVELITVGRPIYIYATDTYSNEYLSIVHGDNYCSFSGNVYDVTDGSALDGATVVAKQNGQAVGQLTDSTDTNGAYSYIGVPLQTETVLTTSKTGYTSQDLTFAPPWSQDWIFDLYMWPDDMSWNGSAIGGIAYEQGSSQGVAGANVHVWNDDGFSTNITANAVGYYLVDNLTADTTYSVQASASDHTDSSVYTGETATDTFTQVDAALQGIYTLTVYVRNSETGNLLDNTSAHISLSDGQDGATSTGSHVFNVNWGTYTVTASADGYYSGSEYVAVDEDATVTVNLIESYGSGVGTYYPPHEVKFSVMDYFGNGLEDVTVTATGIETTIGPWDWLLSLFGISEDTPIYNDTMTGTTDTSGGISFMMFESVKYEMTFFKTGVIDEDMTIYPSDDAYNIFASSGNNEWFDTGYNALNVTNVTISTDENGDSATISVDYYDYLAHTSSVSIWINQTNTSAGWGGEQNNINFSTITDNSDFVETFTVYDYPGESYLIIVSGTQADIGEWERTFSVMFPDEPVSFGLPVAVLPWVAFFIMMFTMLLFGALSATQGTVIIAFEGWLFYALGWFADFGDMIVLPLIFATVIAIVANVMKRSKQERFI